MRAVRIPLLLFCSVLVSLLLGELLVRYAAPINESQLLPFPYNGDRVREIAA